MTTSHLRTGLGSDAVLDGRYRLMQRVGSGGMADVWSATDELLERVVAVKLFRFDTSAADERRIQNEIRTVAALAHPGIVTVFDAGTVVDPESEELGLPYLVMEYVPGRTLASRISSLGPLYEAEARAIGTTVAETLAYVHDRGVIHRDVKPANLLLPDTPGGPAAKITDFGIARVIDSAHHTATGLTVGTANYLAPEQATGASVGFAADVYSLGLVLLECLTGTMAYPGSGVEAALARLHRQPTIPSSLAAPWPDLLAAMTAQEPAARPSAADVVEALGGTRPRVGPALAPVEMDSAAAQTAVLISDPLEETGPLALSELFDAAPPLDTEPPGPLTRTGSHRRRPLVLSAIGMLAAAGVVSGLVLSAGAHGSASAEQASGAVAPSSTASTTAATTRAQATTAVKYASVSGRLGQDLAALELTVGAAHAPELDATARGLLAADVAHVATAAAQRRYASAETLLAIFNADVSAGRATHAVGASRAGIMHTAAAAVQADLVALMQRAHATVSPTAPQHVTASKPAPKPPAAHDHGKHRGHGKG